MRSTPIHVWHGFALLVALLAPGCADVRPGEVARAACISWQEEIAPVFTRRCAECHSGPSAAGGYDLTTYLGALGQSLPGGPAAVAGQDDSPLLVTLNPSSADTVHREFADIYAQVRTWVVDCRLSYFRSAVHAGGILDPAQPAEFHGDLVRELGWNLPLCGDCHGRDYAGGRSGVSCLTCHPGPAGPTGCTTCHGQPPQTGAHLSHAMPGALGKSFDCTECHIKPLVYTDLGHLFLSNGQVDEPPAEVRFGQLAKRTPDPATRRSAPDWNRTTNTCVSVYCHGDAFADTSAGNVQPVWTAVSEGQAACGTCHGLPPSNHAARDCDICHPGIAVSTTSIRDTVRHLDGVIDIGDGSGRCDACHGSPASPAPPRDLRGNTASSATGVGAHTAHLTGLHALRGPIACSECHLVPTAINDPGHIDSDLPAEVFPAPNPGAVLASTDGAQPAWDRASGRCTNVYCHGGGQQLSRDTASGINQAPLWTGSTREAQCGTCHGIPPNDGTHPLSMGLGSCVMCHPDTVDPGGGIIITGLPGQEQSFHLNGVVDVR